MNKDSGKRKHMGNLEEVQDIWNADILDLGYGEQRRGQSDIRKIGRGLYSFFFLRFIYLFMRHTYTQRQRPLQREQASCREPNVGLDSRSWDHALS